MIDGSIRAQAEAFKAELRERLSAYPALVPDSDWPSMSTLDHLSYHLRYRSDWTDQEERFFQGVISLLAHFVHESWSTFHDDVAVTRTDRGIECVATLRRGLFGSTKEYRLPLESSLRAILQEPENPSPALGRQRVIASDATPFLAVYALGACLGMSPYGEGPWADKMPGDLKSHLDAAVPFLADTSARHYARLFGEGAGADPALYRANLIWPPAGYHGDYCGSCAAEGIQAFESSSGRVLGTDELLNLARSPDDTIAGGATVLLLARLDNEGVPPELTEMCFQRIAGNAVGYRRVAIELAKAEGRDSDWLETLDARRFLLEKRLYAIPLVYLSWETASSRRYRKLVRALADMDIAGAQDAVARHVGDGPELLFQQAMLFKVQQQRREAQELFDQIEREYPGFATGEFLNEYGMNCLAVGLNGRPVTLLERAVEAGGTFGRAQSNLGWALLNAGDLERAIEVLDEAVGHTDLEVTALLNRAYARRELGDEEGAEADVATAARLYPFDRRVVSGVMAAYYGR